MKEILNVYVKLPKTHLSVHVPLIDIAICRLMYYTNQNEILDTCILITINIGFVVCILTTLLYQNKTPKKTIERFCSK